MDKFFAQKGRASYPSRIMKEKFLVDFGRKKVYEAGKKVWSAQEYYTIQNKHF